MPRRDDIKKILLIGSGPIVIGQAAEFDYSGCPGLQGAAGGGLRGRAGQLEPGDDHDRPGVRRPHLHRAAAAGPGRQGDRARAARRAAAHPRRADRAQPRQGPSRRRDTGALRRRADRRELRGDPPGRGPRGVPHHHGGGRARACRGRRSSHRSPRRRPASRTAPSACRPSSARPSPLADTAAASATPRPSSPRSSPRASPPARSTRCWSRSPCSAGASSSSR